MKCKYCGTENSDKFVMCVKCGKMLQQEEVESEDFNTNSSAEKSEVQDEDVTVIDVDEVEIIDSDTINDTNEEEKNEIPEEQCACGSTIKKNWNYCANCGRSSIKMNKNNRKKPKENTNIIVALYILAISYSIIFFNFYGILIALIIAIFGKTRNPDSELLKITFKSTLLVIKSMVIFGVIMFSTLLESFFYFCAHCNLP